ncbi:MAG: class I SAM-dependent methyltransferase [Kiritimatiellia bacterium]
MQQVLPGGDIAASSTILDKVYWRLLRLFRLHKTSWDRQFQAGLWCRGPRCPHTVRKAAELCQGGYLIEFGCGEGTLPLAMPEGSFSFYRGYDISGVAINSATQKARRAGLQNCAFARGDMAHWQGDTGASLIVLEECLYYLSTPKAEAFLRCCLQSLLPGGHILVVIHDAAKHASTIEACKRACALQEQTTLGGRLFLLLAIQGHRNTA